jgi:hypothetical protein
MPEETDSSPSSDFAALHRTARTALEQGRATVERTRMLIERAKRFIASLKVPSGPDHSS